ncbi:MAG: CBS domain-containing protein [Spirochaetaceae bacterium]|jgi:CBS domain-containing protein/anti-sigma regulatory factor (Ser/Thr protein kinase)|nr:CBS domain-containing protein [Spirochaetaceae bacterium]
MISTRAIPLGSDSSPEAVVELLFKLKVKDVMSTDVAAAKPGDTMRSIQKLMKTRGFTGVPVLDGDVLAGIVSMDDIIQAFDTGSIDDRVEDHMTKNTIVLQESMPLSFCVSYFNKYGFGRFPVINSEHRLTGIVTQSDVISALLVAMNREFELLEKETQRLAAEKTEPPPRLESGIKTLEFKTEPFNFETAGKASTEIKKQLKAMNVPPELTRRIGIASYELEINQVVHSRGGIMRYYIHPGRLVIEAEDRGPGIPDIAQALTEGFSTASERIRALGFGAGMGLPNTKRVSDDFKIYSSPGAGTIVHATFFLNYDEKGGPR